MKRLFLLSLLICWAILMAPKEGSAISIDFEDIPDLTSVDDFYSSLGLEFSNAISLTAGFSLNEFDYPPSSGLVAVGDDWAPIQITFDSLAENISANFTYASQLTFTAYDNSNSLIGTFVNSGFDNLGGTELIALSFTGVSSLLIAGEWDGSYIMDDFNFDLAPTQPVPEPATLFLFGIGLMGVLTLRLGPKQFKQLLAHKS